MTRPSVGIPSPVTVKGGLRTLRRFRRNGISALSRLMPVAAQTDDPHRRVGERRLRHLRARGLAAISRLMRVAEPSERELALVGDWREAIEDSWQRIQADRAARQGGDGVRGEGSPAPALPENRAMGAHPAVVIRSGAWKVADALARPVRRLFRWIVRVARRGG